MFSLQYFIHHTGVLSFNINSISKPVVVKKLSFSISNSIMDKWVHLYKGLQSNTVLRGYSVFTLESTVTFSKLEFNPWFDSYVYISSTIRTFILETVKWLFCIFAIFALGWGVFFFFVCRQLFLLQILGKVWINCRLVAFLCTHTAVYLLPGSQHRLVGLAAWAACEQPTYIQQLPGIV